MGAICSCCVEATDADVYGSNKLPPYKDWCDLCKDEIGKDPLGICRDFPRTTVLLGEATKEEEEAASSGTVSSPRVMKHADFLARNAKLKTVLLVIMEKLNEDEERRTMFETNWAARIDVLDETTAADISSMMAKVFIDSKLLTWADSDSGEVFSVDAPDSPVMHGKDIHMASVTAKLIAHFHQGFVFYPVQRMHFLLWFPWASRLQDVDWTVRFFTREKFPEYVYVLHSHKSRNFVDPDQKNHIPHFEVSWETEVTLDAKTCDWIDGEMRITRVRVTKAPAPFTSKLWKARRAALEDRITSNFSSIIDIQECSAL